jgi:capsular exopolysaccharide synthesis family protein
MSRIYEALQKAESERTVEREAEPREREPFVPPSDNLMPPPSNGEVVEMRTAAAVVEREYSYPDALASTSLMPEPSATSHGEIVRRPWSPSLAQLPALLQRGPAVEQFRSLRSRIYELRDVRPLKSILVTSGMPQEGKSFISINLAMSLARHKNSRVLLIDGDMRRFTLHQILGCESHPGLADYLGGKSGITEVLQRAEQPQPNQVALPNLTFIAGGNGGDKAADLSGSPRFGELIRAVSPNFDWIIVDSSPVLPVSDAVNLARSCDGVLLVARGGVTKFPVAQRAQSELKASNVLGVVLNAVHEAPQVGDYYGYDASQD